jgi:hypothetical protein
MARTIARKSVPFSTVFASAPDRVSAPVTIKACLYDKETRTIKVMGSDGNVRSCRLERLPSINVGRALWKEIKDCGKNKVEVTFTAAGGFSPDTWFYKIDRV